jgi:hypothetical protein
MARSRQSAFDDLLEIASKLPWQVSLGLAAISLLALHLLAVTFAATPTVTTVADMGGVVIHQGIHVGAFFLQFVVPPAFLIGATVSYLKRSRSFRLFEDTRTGGRAPFFRNLKSSLIKVLMPPALCFSDRSSVALKLIACASNQPPSRLCQPRRTIAKCRLRRHCRIDLVVSRDRTRMRQKDRV